jgi:glycosyltransferase involved in cell wall biosynthesis
LKNVEIKLTVFTPTYNRADLLMRGYEALKRQTCKDFEWLIVDDGSTDNTEELVQKKILPENEFKVRYIKKANGGLHTGYNTAIENINTELCTCVDSDDYLADDAVEKILAFWEEYGLDKVAGIVAPNCDLDGKVIGTFLPNQKTINLIDLMAGKYKGIYGDRINIVRTDLYKEVAPVPTFEGEKFFNPHWLHLKICQKYDFLVCNDCLRVVDYQPAGMSNSMLRQYYNSPNSFREIRRLYLQFKNVPLKFVVKNCIHFSSSCFLAKKAKGIFKSPRPVLTFLLCPFGFALSRYIKSKIKKGQANSSFTKVKD